MAVVKFDGKLLEENGTVFINDTDTNRFQWGLEIVAKGIFDLTIASIDNNGNRKEYVVTSTVPQLRSLQNLIERVLSSTANNA